MEFKLRPMEAKDLDNTLMWRNDPDVLKTALTPNIITAKEHEAMFLYNNSIKLIFEVNGDPAGYVQVSRDPDKAQGEWSFHMSKRYRGQGLSNIMLGAALYYLAKKEGYTKIYSQVKEDNKISRNVHAKLGFSIDMVDSHYHLSKKLCSS